MGIVDTVKQYFGIKAVEPVSVYCQNCGIDLTAEGGDVSSSGRIYCHGYKEEGDSRCLDKEMSLMNKGEIPMGMMVTNLYDAKEVQKLVREGTLSRYGPLEEKVL